MQTAVTVATILTSVGEIVTSGVSWVGDFTGAVTGNPLILLFVVTSFVGLGIGLIKRLIRL